MVANIQLSAFPALYEDMRLKKPKKPRKPKTFVNKRCVARVLHLGAGRQSSTLAEMVVEGVLPSIDFAVFADTGDEPEWVYAQVEYLKGRFASVGVPLHIVRKHSDFTIITEIMNNRDSRFASLPFYTRAAPGQKHGQIRRQCTSEWKIQPSNDFLLTWLVERGDAQIYKNGARHIRANRYVEDLYGISLDEPWRMKERGAAYRKTVYPLNDMGMTTRDCIDWLTTRGLPVPKKSSCKHCPYHGDEYWLDLHDNYPPYFAEVCTFDDWIRSAEAKEFRQIKGLRQDCFLHHSCKPLRDIDFSALVAEKRRHSNEGMGFAWELFEQSCNSNDAGASCMS